ncbi:hypothetical protein Hanom_Chr00s000001g01596511 [Helianthus anomalus]
MCSTHWETLDIHRVTFNCKNIKYILTKSIELMHEYKRAHRMKLYAYLLPREDHFRQHPRWKPLVH